MLLRIIPLFPAHQSQTQILVRGFAGFTSGLIGYETIDSSGCSEPEEKGTVLTLIFSHSQTERVPTFTTDINGNPVQTGYSYSIDNGRVLYSISGGNDLGHFVINRDNGSITVAPGHQLNLDKQASYLLTINASDPYGLFNTALLNITVIDSNDNAPVLYRPKPFSLNISEATPKGFEILRDAYANDTDRGINAQVRKKK